MAQDVEIAVSGANFEKNLLRAVPLIEHLLNLVLMLVCSKTKGPSFAFRPESQSTDTFIRSTISYHKAGIISQLSYFPVSSFQSAGFSRMNFSIR